MQLIDMYIVQHLTSTQDSYPLGYFQQLPAYQ